MRPGKKVLGAQDFRLLGEAQSEEERALQPVIYRRVCHCMSEHHRTIVAANALKSSDTTVLGNLMNESYISMHGGFRGYRCLRSRGAHDLMSK